MYGGIIAHPIRILLVEIAIAARVVVALRASPCKRLKKWYPSPIQKLSIPALSATLAYRTISSMGRTLRKHIPNPVIKADYLLSGLSDEFNFL